MALKKKKVWKSVGVALGTLSVLYALFIIFYAMPLAKEATRIDTNISFKRSQDALKKDSNNLPALRGMAEHFNLRKDFPQAIAYWRQAVKVEPDNTFNKSQLAMVLLRAGQPDEARHIFEELASTSNPENELAQHALKALKKDPNWGYFPYKPRITSPMPIPH